MILESAFIESLAISVPLAGLGSFLSVRGMLRLRFSVMVLGDVMLAAAIVSFLYFWCPA